MYKKTIKREENEYTYYYTNVRKENLIYFNNSISSDVLSTFISNCSFSFLSLDQIGQFSFNANAKYCVSFGSGDIESALSLNSLYSDTGINLINHDKTFLYNSKVPVFILDFDISSCEYLFNSSNEYIGEYNSKLGLDNSFLVNVCFLKNENKIFISTTNSIYNASFKNFSCMDFFASLPMRIQSSSVNSEFSNILSSFLSSKALLTFSYKSSLTISDQFNSGNSSISDFNSFGIDNVKFGILVFPLNSVYFVKDVEVFKSFYGVSDV